MLPEKFIKRAQKTKVTSKYIGPTHGGEWQQENDNPVPSLFLPQTKYILFDYFYEAHVIHFLL